jgi:hypothetical protein
MQHELDDMFHEAVTPRDINHRQPPHGGLWQRDALHGRQVVEPRQFHVHLGVILVLACTRKPQITPRGRRW